MDLTTRCPQCGTTFSASLAQLQLRKGYIRCINCAHIFDGYESVVPADEVENGTGQRDLSAPDPVVSIPSVVRQRTLDNETVHTVASSASAAHVPHSSHNPSFTISSKPPTNTPPQDESPVFRVGRTAPLKPEPGIGAPHVRTRAGATQPEQRPVDAKPFVYIEPRQSAVGSDRGHDLEFLDPGPSRSVAIASLVWGLLIVIGLGLLVAQLSYVYRAQIANNVPMLRPALEQLCEPLQCRVAYSRRIEMISIMNSSLRATPADPKEAVGEPQAAASSSMTLQVTLRNTLDKPQEWPTLVLDLTDFSGALIVRRNLPPEAYLPAQSLQQPFAAGSEIAVSLPIVLKGLQVNGYKVDKFFQ